MNRSGISSVQQPYCLPTYRALNVPVMSWKYPTTWQRRKYLLQRKACRMCSLCISICICSNKGFCGRHGMQISLSPQGKLLAMHNALCFHREYWKREHLMCRVRPVGLRLLKCANSSFFPLLQINVKKRSSYHYTLTTSRTVAWCQGEERLHNLHLKIFIYWNHHKEQKRSSITRTLKVKKGKLCT